MFTPQEIQEKTFVKAVFGGYDMQTVDDFLEPLTEDYITLYKENSVLKSKMKVLVEKAGGVPGPGGVYEKGSRCGPENLRRHGGGGRKEVRQAPGRRRGQSERPHQRICSGLCRTRSSGWKMQSSWPSISLTSWKRTLQSTWICSRA